MPTISGVTKDATGAPCASVVDVRRRDTGKLIARTVSDATTGAYAVTVPDTGPFIVTRFVAPVIAGAANWASTIVDIQFDGAFEDRKDHLVSVTGSVAIDTATTDPFAGNAGVATFAGGRIDFADRNDLHPSGDFTLRFRFRPTGSSRAGLVAYGDDFYMGLDYGYNGTRNVNMWASSNGSSWDILQSDGGGSNSGIGALSLTLNAWNNIEITRAGNVWRSFINGVLDREVTASGTVFRGSKGLRIGSWGNGGFPAAGSMSDFVFIGGVAEHTASYTPAATRSLGSPKPGTPTEDPQSIDIVTPI